MGLELVTHRDIQPQVVITFNLYGGYGHPDHIAIQRATTQAFRAPDHAVALDLIRATGPIYATSANRSDEPDTLGADEVLIAFAVQQDELAAVLDGGPVPGGVASTVIDVSVDPARILREGPVTRDALAEVVELAG